MKTRTIIILTGPMASGKTTLARKLFPPDCIFDHAGQKGWLVRLDCTLMPTNQLLDINEPVIICAEVAEHLQQSAAFNEATNGATVRYFKMGDHQHNLDLLAEIEQIVNV